MRVLVAEQMEKWRWETRGYCDAKASLPDLRNVVLEVYRLYYIRGFENGLKARTFREEEVPF